MDVTIIGVIGDFKNAGVALAPQPQITVLYSQHPLVNGGFKDIVIRTASEPHLVESEIRSQLRALDSDMPLAEVQTIDELVERQTGGQRFTTVLLASFAVAGSGARGCGHLWRGVFSRRATQAGDGGADGTGCEPVNVLWLVLKQVWKCPCSAQ